jgi:hypothetical protein
MLAQYLRLGVTLGQWGMLAGKAGASVDAFLADRAHDAKTE